jgi:Zn finger protein HypA/HybF involved in hydrogenase expression
MGITLETTLKGFVNMKLDRAMINCAICNKSMEKFRNKNTCSPECKRKLACQRQAKYNLNIRKPWEPTEEELRESFPEFYATCKTIVWGKRILKKCLKCGANSNIANGGRICPQCSRSNEQFGRMACLVS